ncbi:MAG: epoxide hydrolase family protein [Gammaproteobacteria bacterium]
MVTPHPFRIDIPQNQLDDLHQRLDSTRWPRQTQTAQDQWQAGVPVDYLRTIIKYWRHEFDWRAQEAQLNELPQYRCRVGDVDVHFVHQPSTHPAAIPLVMTHGWPGSFVEFQKLVGPLTQPERYGGDAADAFHLICPSIPGYTFSSAPESSGWNTQKIARTQLELIKILGYNSYGVQGGDWGSMISSSMARQDPDNCLGLHLNMVVAMPPETANPMEGVTELEQKGLQAMQHWQTEGGGYFRIQATRPETLGFGLTDSPVGLAAWILEKFRDWSDCDGDISNTLDLDQVLTNISLYWFTGSITSAARLYYEEEHSERDFSFISVPTGAALYPAEIFSPPKIWAEKMYNIQHWNRYQRGGHFAAMEVPDLLLEDVRTFFRPLRK